MIDGSVIEDLGGLAKKLMTFSSSCMPWQREQDGKNHLIQEDGHVSQTTTNHGTSKVQSHLQMKAPMSEITVLCDGDDRKHVLAPFQKFIRELEKVKVDHFLIDRCK